MTASQEIEQEIEAIAIPANGSTFPKELMNALNIAEQTNKQSVEIKNAITGKILEVFQNSVRSDISPLALHVTTCQDYGFSHDLPFTQVDDLTGLATEGTKRIKGLPQPNTFKTMATKCKVLHKEGYDITSFVDTINDKGNTVTAVSKLTKAYNDYRKSLKVIVDEMVKTIEDKCSDEEILEIIARLTK